MVLCSAEVMMGAITGDMMLLTDYSSLHTILIHYNRLYF